MTMMMMMMKIRNNHDSKRPNVCRLLLFYLLLLTGLILIDVTLRQQQQQQQQQHQSKLRILPSSSVYVSGWIFVSKNINNNYSQRRRIQSNLYNQRYLPHHPQQQSRLHNRLFLNNKPESSDPSIVNIESTVGTSTTIYNNNNELRINGLTDTTPKVPTNFMKTAVIGPDVATKPDYEAIVGPLGKFMDIIFLIVFRKQLAYHVGWDSTLPIWDFNGIIEITQYMNRTYKSRTKIQETAQAVLRSLFPSWLPSEFAKLFSKPFPQFSSRLNAWATYVAGTWLMGECTVNDVVLEDGTILEKQGLLVTRCRFLEESSCASVCVNSCKIPTQNFFIQDMGLPLLMEPNYTTYECQFSFGKTPTVTTEAVAISTPCLSRCPTFGSIRTYHDSYEKNQQQQQQQKVNGLVDRVNGRTTRDILVQTNNVTAVDTVSILPTKNMNITNDNRCQIMVD